MPDSTATCRGYCCVYCVDGSCPIANMNEYQERGYPVVRGCSDCMYYEGCDGCDFRNTDACTKKG